MQTRPIENYTGRQRKKIIIILNGISCHLLQRINSEKLRDVYYMDGWVIIIEGNDFTTNFQKTLMLRRLTIESLTNPTGFFFRITIFTKKQKKKNDSSMRLRIFFEKNDFRPTLTFFCVDAQTNEKCFLCRVRLSVCRYSPVTH